MSVPQNEQFDTLRMQIELSIPAHAIIVVTSAKADDGSSVAANGLADCLARAGYRVALLASDYDSAPDTESSRFTRHAFASQLDPAKPTNDAVAVLAGAFRHEYHYTVIDAPPLAGSSVSMLLANTAEAVLIAIRLGRSRCREDTLMMHSLQLAQARVLGVIGACVHDQDRARATSSAREEPPARSHATGKAAAVIARTG